MFIFEDSNALGNGILINGDCLEEMKKIPDNSIDLILTDPPFNVGLDYSKTTLSGVDNWDNEDYSKWCGDWLKSLYRASKQGSFAIVFTGDKNLYYIFQAVMSSGYTYHHILKWHKPNCQRALSGTVFFNRTELAFILSKGKPEQSRINRKELYSDTIIFNNQSVSDGDVGHPARRPISLYETIIKGFTNKNNIVLDPFLGSGTTAIACEKLQRKWIGIEISKEYCELTRKRIEPWINQTRINAFGQSE